MSKSETIGGFSRIGMGFFLPTPLSGKSSRISRQPCNKEPGRFFSKTFNYCIFILDVISTNPRNHDEQKTYDFGWNSDSQQNNFSSKHSSTTKQTNKSSANLSFSNRNSMQFSSQHQTHPSNSTVSGIKLNSSQVSESQNEEIFKGNIYFMKFENLKWFFAVI